ncbi:MULTISPECIES: CBS domain-containing protein [unclassified Methanobrevibacter]|jgi:CBS domain-containing protein|uniref:CBS domain-containing protein n=1 Tax=unclassified Methanobrevibacter TaxID=2638681 RepID=UPI0039B8B9D3
MQIKNLMSENPITIDKNKNICDCLRIMYKDDLSRIPVIKSVEGNKKELVGIISEKDIANKLGSSKYADVAISHFHVSTVMVKDVITVDENADSNEVANILHENNIGALPVMSDDELVGIVTKSDFINLCKGKPFEKISVKDAMTQDIISVAINDRLVHARRVIMDSGIGRLLVSEEHELAGIITSKDIAKAYVSFKKHTPEKHHQAQLKNLVVEDVMSTNIQKVYENDSISEVAEKMLETGFNGYPVSNEDNDVVGIITQSDLLKILIDLESQ